MDRNARAYFSGRITKKQYIARQRAQSVGGLAAFAVVVGAVVAPEVATALLSKAGRTAAVAVARKAFNSDSAKQIESAVVRKTRSGEKAARITKKDQSVIDISPQRVKEYTPNTHPEAPPGTLNKVKYQKYQPGSKGYKRDPTPEELKVLRDLE